MKTTHTSEPRSVRVQSLYQDPLQGTHHYVLRDSGTFSFRPPQPFLSIGNFDQIAPDKVPISNPKTYSCGNFLTSTKLEGWPSIAGLTDGLPRFGVDSLQHQPTNLKFFVGRQSRGYFQQSGHANKQLFRQMSHEGKDQFGQCEEDILQPKTLTLTKANGKAMQVNGEGAINKHRIMTSPIKQYQQASPIQHRESQNSNSDQSANEFELLSDGNEERGSRNIEKRDFQDIDEVDEDAAEKLSQEETLGRLFSDIRRECLSQLLNKKATAKKADVILGDEGFDIIEERELSGDELLEMSMRDKDSSIRVQSYLKEQTSDNLDRVAIIFWKHVETLILNKFGNYVIQYLIQIHEPSQDHIGKVTLSSFLMYAENEYGSRIMQKLCSVSAEYCKSALGVFQKYFDRLIKSITGSILLSKLISSSQNEQEYLFCIRILESNKEYLRKAYFNRMLSTLVSCCSDAILQEVVSLIRNHIWVLMNDKFGNYVLQIILERGQPLGASLVKTICFKNYSVIFTRKYPKFLLIKIVELELLGDFSNLMTKKILELDAASLFNLLSKRDSAMLLLLMFANVELALFKKAADRTVRILKSHNPVAHCKFLLILDQEFMGSLDKLHQSITTSQTDTNMSLSSQPSAINAQLRVRNY